MKVSGICSFLLADLAYDFHRRHLKGPLAPQSQNRHRWGKLTR